VYLDYLKKYLTGSDIYEINFTNLVQDIDYRLHAMLKVTSGAEPSELLDDSEKTNVLCFEIYLDHYRLSRLKEQKYVTPKIYNAVNNFGYFNIKTTYSKMLLAALNSSLKQTDSVASKNAEILSAYAHVKDSIGLDDFIKYARNGCEQGVE